MPKDILVVLEIGKKTKDDGSQETSCHGSRQQCFWCVPRQFIIERLDRRRTCDIRLETAACHVEIKLRLTKSGGWEKCTN
jgi:hypothetical protein